jgi:hypothetical protein
MEGLPKALSRWWGLPAVSALNDRKRKCQRTSRISAVGGKPDVAFGAANKNRWSNHASFAIL